jgi:hypothetical protein
MSKKFTIIEGSTMQSCIDCRNQPTKEVIATKKFLFLQAQDRRPFCDSHAEQEKQSLLNQGFIFDRSREVVTPARALPQSPPNAAPAPVELPLPPKLPDKKPVHLEKTEPIIIRVEVDVKNNLPAAVVTVTKKKAPPKKQEVVVRDI